MANKLLLLSTELDEPSGTGGSMADAVFVTNAQRAKRFESDLDSVLILSKLTNADTAVQLKNIEEAFNKRSLGGQDHLTLNDVITRSTFRGRRLRPGRWLIAHRDQRPFITADHERRLAAVINLKPGVVVEIVGEFDMHQLHMEAFGSHLINVPVNMLAKVTIGTASHPVLFSQGVHVVHDSTLRLDEKTALVSASQEHISHGSIHILRVAPGKLALAWVGTVALMLPSRVKPYVFNDPLFRFVGTVSQNEPLISHGNQHILRVPSGMVARLWVNNKAVLLEARDEPFVFDTPYFRVDMVNESSSSFFVSATEKAIIHGSIKRLVPSTGEVAICYDAGKLTIVEPSGCPFIIDSEVFFFDGFLSTAINTEVFPSKATKDDRRSENRNDDPDSINYEIVTTRDSLKLGVKLMLTYWIVDPFKLLSKLRRSEILRHIENVACTDLSRSIQQTTSQQFLSFNTANHLPSDHDSNTAEQNNLPALVPSAPPMENFVDTVKTELQRDLREIGIQLMRLNIESPKVLDKETAKSMEQQSLLLAQAAAQEAVLETQFVIARQKADQEAEVKRIAQEQQNQAIISKADAENRAKVASAEAEMRTAEARKQIRIIEAQAEREAALLRGEQYTAQPQLMQLELARMQMEALQKATVQLLVTPDEMRKGLGSVLLSGFNPLNRVVG